MHFFTVVLAEAGSPAEAESQVSELMEPFESGGGSIAMEEDQFLGLGTWDFWKAGGRYEGWLGASNVLDVAGLRRGLEAGSIEYPVSLVTPDKRWFGEDTFTCEFWKDQVIKLWTSSLPAWPSPSTAIPNGSSVRPRLRSLDDESRS